MSERHEYQLLFHPPGVIRVISPAELAAARRAPADATIPVRSRATNEESVLVRLSRTLRRLATGWLNAQRQGWI